MFFVTIEFIIKTVCNDNFTHDWILVKKSNFDKFEDRKKNLIDEETFIFSIFVLKYRWIHLISGI